MFQQQYPRHNMSFRMEDPRSRSMNSVPTRGTYNSDIVQSDPNTRKNKFVPPLMQVRTLNNVPNTRQRQVAMKKQIVNSTNQSPSVFNRSYGTVSENQSPSVFSRNGRTVMETASMNQPTTSNTFKRTDSMSNANTSFRARKATNISTGVLEMSVEDSMIPNPRSAGTSRANSMAEFNVRGTNNSVQIQSNETAVNTNVNLKIFGSTANEKMFVFTGTVERVIKWNKIFRNHFCYYEVIASVISIQEGSVSSQKIMLLRDKKGPILQVVYYSNTHIDIEDFYVEQVLRCVGRMGSPNILNAISIRSATKEEVETLQRLCLVCDQAISHFLSI